MPNLYIIAGCNGAGKTTASYTVLPELLNCNEFVNADNIAAGLSPFNPESVAFEAGRIMLQRIDELLNREVDFAFETTLSTRSYVFLVKRARQKGYEVTLLFFWLSSPEMAMERVAKRVSKGGHNIPVDVIERRYYRGIRNLVSLYIPLCDRWFVINNMNTGSLVVARGFGSLEETIIESDIWKVILDQANDN
ncbi:AAA family ATPase [Mucilaginibacter rubeus]|uniref:AAA family ATPase n=1 Tax=Mucilaginibacter rubeus TaxID=2027860 RepID=A0AAE6JKC9_9SPHI|nr:MULTISPECIES: zeta toxin family protein [Mucilaginibacter]QEM06998.1 AAA family ATPase [Mucilaginibacter rubeus]QEM19586.1 AAA family ATPase [Mucilaginibacter gossypii]QTE43860.1 zeta toxin family protein [Mucilaginibacter rubeus]QTE50461.1 zeta toxin family protein [Mucilaginibacter rubeus]QTE55546.1 zeta toxin family protein [Mucilaginibacter rubeus]